MNNETESSTPKVETKQIEKPEDVLYFNKDILPQMKKMDVDEPLHLAIGDKFLRRWLIDGLIGKGGYGEIYFALDMINGKNVAIKVEPKKRKEKLAKRMILEQHVLFKLQGKPHVPIIYGSGHHENINYISELDSGNYWWNSNFSYASVEYQCWRHEEEQSVETSQQIHCRTHHPSADHGSPRSSPSRIRPSRC